MKDEKNTKKVRKMIYWDLDGSLNLFYVGSWLEDILARNPRPYIEAKCQIKEKTLLHLISLGYELGVISWLAKDSTKEYDSLVRKAKKDWLKRNYPNIKFKEIHIVKYGTPKWRVAKDRDGILFDDEEKNRKDWKGKSYEPLEVFNF